MQDEDDDFSYDRDDDPCDHEDRDVDILSGRCQCYHCGESWYATGAEIDAELRFQSEYAEAMDREYRQQWWRDLLWAVRHPLVTIHWKLQERGWLRPRPTSGDFEDDIPF